MTVLDDDASTLLQTRFDPTTQDASFEVVVLHGPDTGNRWLLDGSQPYRSLVGVSASCHIQLSDVTISRRHLALDIDADRLRITDLGSKNGTIVDGTSLLDGYLRGGETIHVGSTTLRVNRTASADVTHTPASRFGRTLGASTEMRRLYPLCERLASSDIPLLIEGETGTGKEVLAVSLHEEGVRSSGAFVVFDCTAVPAHLVESQLFGHVRGAFTGAHARHTGLFARAHGGTLLIDEIGDLDLPLQAKLLRAVDRREVVPVGGTQPTAVDVRILAATRRDLDREVQAGRFRDDLFHRLVVGRVELPPLRKRKGDLPLLSYHFASEFETSGRSIPESVILRWEEHTWPGNVRELRNAVARYLVLGDLAGIDPLAAGAEEDDTLESLLESDLVEQVLSMDLPLPEAKSVMVREFSKRYMDRALSEHDGNVTRAAAASGVARRYFQLLRAKLSD